MARLPLKVLINSTLGLLFRTDSPGGEFIMFLNDTGERVADVSNKPRVHG